MVAGGATAVDDFADWVRPHLGGMTRLAARLAPDSDADDIVQEALTRAWRKRRQYDANRGTPGAWLLAITADRARRTRRAAGRAGPILVDVAEPPVATDEHLDLAGALDRLAPRQRLAVDCVYFAGLTVAEAATVMGCAQGTVKSTLSDARARLRSAMEVSG